MSAATLIAEAAQLGITLWAEGTSLRFRPKGAMTKELAERLTVNKADFIHALERTCKSPSHPPRAISPDEAAFWIACLREAGCRIELDAGVPKIEWTDALATPGRVRDWEANIGLLKAVLEAEQHG